MRLLLVLLLLLAPGIAQAEDVAASTSTLFRIGDEKLSVLMSHTGSDRMLLISSPAGWRIDMLVDAFDWREVRPNWPNKVPVQDTYRLRLTTAAGSRFLVLPWPHVEN